MLNEYHISVLHSPKPTCAITSGMLLFIYISVDLEQLLVVAGWDYIGYGVVCLSFS